jgi:hypothetical protein
MSRRRTARCGCTFCLRYYVCVQMRGPGCAWARFRPCLGPYSCMVPLLALTHGTSACGRSRSRCLTRSHHPGVGTRSRLHHRRTPPLTPTYIHRHQLRGIVWVYLDFYPIPEVSPYKSFPQPTKRSTTKGLCVYDLERERQINAISTACAMYGKAGYYYLQVGHPLHAQYVAFLINPN